MYRFFNRSKDRSNSKICPPSVNRGLFSFIFTCCPCLSAACSFTSSRYMPKIDIGPQISSKKTLVLDMDETLIHSNLFMPDAYDFTIKMRPEGQQYIFYIKKRPGVDAFLKAVNEKFELVIYTASIQPYADPIIEKIAPFVPQDHRLYRHHCLYRDDMYYKDLSCFNRPLKDIIIVDNSSISYELQPTNGLSIQTWTGRRNDRELMNRILPILMSLENVTDVRTTLAEIQKSERKRKID